MINELLYADDLVLMTNTMEDLIHFEIERMH